VKYVAGEEPECSHLGWQIQDEGLTQTDEESPQNYEVVALVDQQVEESSQEVEPGAKTEADPHSSAVDDLVGWEVGQEEDKEAKDDRQAHPCLGYVVDGRHFVLERRHCVVGHAIEQQG
jgi:hypothetical protein